MEEYLKVQNLTDLWFTYVIYLFKKEKAPFSKLNILLKYEVLNKKNSHKVQNFKCLRTILKRVLD